MTKRRITLLITTCAKPELMEKQRASGADVVILELEDGVPIDQKAQARALAVEALRDWDYVGKERWVRINSVASVDGMRDIVELAPSLPDALVLGKLRTRDEVVAADYLLTRREEELGLPAHTKLVPMVESGPALIHLEEIVRASDRVIGVLVGTEDLSVDVGYVRTPHQVELIYARSQIVTVSHSLGIGCYDVASVVLRDQDALYDLARESYHFGFDGKAIISPSQIAAVERAFGPSEDEVDWARKIAAAEAQAQREGKSVYEVDGKMVDGPFVKMAHRILAHVGDEGEPAT